MKNLVAKLKIGYGSSVLKLIQSDTHRAQVCKSILVIEVVRKTTAVEQVLCEASLDCFNAVNVFAIVRVPNDATEFKQRSHKTRKSFDAKL